MAPDASLSKQAAFYVGMHLHDILYGVELCLYFRTMHVFLARKRTRQKSDVFYGVFSSVMFLLVTVWIAVLGSFGQAAWIWDLIHPPRPIPYGYIDFVAVVTIILQQMTDSLMMYRCRIVWDSSRVLIVPSILWLATLVLGILVIWAAGITKTDFFSGTAAKIGLAYYSTSVLLNMILTCMICYRLLSYAKTVKEYLGDHHASPYFTIMMVLVESVLPFTLSGVAYLISYGVGSQTEVAISHVYTIMTMLILRVAEGNAWQKDSTLKAPLSTIQFTPGRRDLSNSGIVPTGLEKDSEV